MTADDIIQTLGLLPHPEGGHFVETWRAASPAGQRSPGTAIYFLDRDYMMTLFDSPMGQLALVIAAIMQIFGYLWIRKIVNIEI